MEKIKEYITKNKKIVIPVVIIIILLLIGGIYFAVQSNSDHSDSKIESTKQEANKSKGKETTKDLDTYVKGIKDWTIEVGAKNINFLKDFTFDKKVIKDVTVDASKVDLTKEGKYDLTYNIIPIDTTIDKKTVIKTVEVISKEKAQKEADKGNQVITSDNEIKKKSKDNDADSKKEVASNKNNSNTSNSQNTNGNSHNNNNNGGSKPNTDNNSGNSSSNNSKPSESTKPTEPVKPVHQHDFSIYVPEKSHTEYVTETCEEQVPIYEYVEWFECNYCHEHFDNATDVAYHCLTVCGCNYTLKGDNIQTGYSTETKTRQKAIKVVDDPAHYECSCGARK
jgi:hypothetical protein